MRPLSQRAGVASRPRSFYGNDMGKGNVESLGEFIGFAGHSADKENSAHTDSTATIQREGTISGEGQYVVK